MNISVEHGVDIAFNHKQFIALIKSKIDEELEDYDEEDGHNHKAEKPKFKFVDEFLKDTDSYIYTVLHDCVEMVAQKYLGAEKMYFTKSFEFEVPESGLIKAIDLSEFVNRMRPFFRKAKGFFGRKKTEPLKINKKVLYNPVTGKLLTNAEFEQIANDITEFLGDRLNGTDEEMAVKSAFMGLMQRKFEQKGIPHEKTKDMSYAELDEKYGVPSTIAELTEKEKLKPDSQIIRAIEFAKENAGNLLRVPQGRIRNALVDAVRQQIVQGLQENLSPQELSQRLFYTDTSDQLPSNLREANINAINRDWRRVARTELSIAMNNGYLLSLMDDSGPGEKKYVYYDGHFSVTDKFGSPTDCNKFLGEVCLLVSQPRRSGKLTGDPYAKYAVWPGKTNNDNGRTPSIPTHPHCYSKDTRVLTNHGWKYFKDVKKTDLIFSLNPKTFELEYVKFDEIIAFKYSGEMYNFIHQNVDLLVTRDHNMIAGKRQGKNAGRKIKHSIYKAKDLYENHKEFSIPRTGVWAGVKRTPREKLIAELLGWYVAEGSRTSAAIRISQSKESGRKAIVAILKKLRVGHTLEKPGVYVHKSEFVNEYFSEFTGKLSYDKYVPQWVKNSDVETIKAFLRGFIQGDGHERTRTVFGGYETTEKVYHTCSEILVADVCELLYKIGKSATVAVAAEKGKIVKHRNGEYAQSQTVYTIREVTKKTAHFNKKSGIVRKLYYSDMVYCLSLQKNHIMLVERNGMTAWSGNCLHWWSEINPQKHTPVIKSAKTGKVLTNKDLARHDMERDGDVYVQLIEREKS